MEPPVAPRKPHRHEIHGDVRIDDYYWFRQRQDPEVLRHLEAENTYVDQCLGHTQDLQDCLFHEIKGRIKQTDVSVAYVEGTYSYYWRYEDGKEYRIHCRKPLQSDTEQVVLDINRIAEGCDYCHVETLAVSPSERLLGYAIDTIGRRWYDIRFRDLDSNAPVGDVIRNVTGNFVWANDSLTLFYTRQHATTLRSYQVYRHRLGQDASKDELVYEEFDETFSCAVGKSRSKRYIFVGTYQTLTTEYHVLDADQPNRSPRLFVGRRTGHEYHLDHFRDHFYIRSNDKAPNFLMCETGDEPGEWDEPFWRELIPHRDDVMLETFELFDGHLVIQERTDGLVRLYIKPWNSEADHYVKFSEPAYDAYIDAHNVIPDTTVLRFGYSSLSIPSSEYDYDMVTRERVLLKREGVLGGFDSENYRTERLYATSDDGVQVPISLVLRKDTPLDGTAPLLLYGYGSYGISMDAGFRSSRLSLLDRGFVFAIAHVRGGQELGRYWYEYGKFLNKKNTFTDFIACAEHLVSAEYTNTSRLFAMGGSAGGLLIGAVCNQRPDLFHGLIAQVPFVDVLTTMLDETIPLTTGEYDEWGNPNNPDIYEYMKSYSPYDNVVAARHPHILVMTGLHDSQVQYWEPAKWVAKLRAVKTGDQLLLFKTDLDSGHGGASGRYKQYRETALQYAFLLDLVQSSSVQV